MTSSDEQLTQLNRRIDRLEKRLHRARWLGVAAVASAGLVLMGAAKRPKDLIAGRIEAESLAIRDKNGVVRAAIVTGPSMGAGGEVDVANGVSSGLILYDDAGKLRAELAVGPDNQPRLRLSDAADMRRFSVNMGSRMFDLELLDDGHVRARLASYQGAGEGATELLLQGPNERSITLRADAKDDPSLIIRDPEGTIVTRLPAAIAKP
jgi:hypothetical protein